MLRPAQGITALDSELRAAELRGARPERRLAGRNFTKADILLYRLPSGPVAVKDYGPRPWWIRATVGRWLVRREVAALEQARGLAGLPPLVGRIGPHALATRWIDARPLAEHEPGDVPAGTFDSLERIVASLHERGVALGDLHHRDVLLDRDGAVWVVDLATAWITRPGAGRLSRTIGRRLADADAVALARLRARYTGGDPELAVAALGPAIARRHRRARHLKRLWNRLRRKR